MCPWTPLKKAALLQETPQNKEMEERRRPLSQSMTLLTVRSAVGFLRGPSTRSPPHEGDLCSPGDGLKSFPADETRDSRVIATRVSDSAS